MTSPRPEDGPCRAGTGASSPGALPGALLPGGWPLSDLGTAWCSRVEGGAPGRARRGQHAPGSTCSLTWPWPAGAGPGFCLLALLLGLVTKGFSFSTLTGL